MTSIDAILFPEGRAIPGAPYCDHYAGSEKLIQKSFEIQQTLGPIFEITCDLEDGAQIGSELLLRKRIGEILMSDLNRLNAAGVRVHDFTSSFFEDDVKEIVRIAGKKLSHITIPKISSLSQAREVIAYIKKCCTDQKLPKVIPIHLLIETHQALHDVWDIAALPGLRGLDFGIMDFISSHQGAISDQYMRSPGQFEHPLIVRAKTEMTAACIAHGIIPCHNVTIEYRDTTKAFDDALRARVHFGFLRMWSIHPNQIQPIVDAFKPDEDQLHTAYEIISAAKDARWGPITYKNTLYDKASFRFFWTLLKRARSAGMKISEDILSLFSDNS